MRGQESGGLIVAMTLWETRDERRGPAQLRRERRLGGRRTVSPCEQPPIPGLISRSSLLSARTGYVRVAWPKAELELPTGNPYGQFGRAVPAGNRWSDSTAPLGALNHTGWRA